MHAFIVGHVDLNQILLGLVFVGFRLLAAVEVEALEALLTAAVGNALHSAHLSIKEAAHCMGLDPEQLRRQLANEPKQYLSLKKMLMGTPEVDGATGLPFAFWLHFSPALVQIVYTKRMREFAETANEFKRRA